MNEVNQIDVTNYDEDFEVNEAHLWNPNYKDKNYDPNYQNKNRNNSNNNNSSNNSSHSMTGYNKNYNTGMSNTKNTPGQANQCASNPHWTSQQGTTVQTSGSPETPITIQRQDTTKEVASNR